MVFTYERGFEKSVQFFNVVVAIGDGEIVDGAIEPLVLEQGTCVGAVTTYENFGAMIDSSGFVDVGNAIRTAWFVGGVAVSHVVELILFDSNVTTDHVFVSRCVVGGIGCTFDVSRTADATFCIGGFAASNRIA